MKKLNIAKTPKPLIFDLDYNKDEQYIVRKGPKADWSKSYLKEDIESIISQLIFEVSPKQDAKKIVKEAEQTGNARFYVNPEEFRNLEKKRSTQATVHTAVIKKCKPEDQRTSEDRY